MEGEIRRDNLWALLSLMTVRKARRHLRRESTLHHGGEHQRVNDVDAIARDELDRLCPQEFGLYSHELLEALPVSLRPLALLRLAGHTNREVATHAGCMERTVERELNAIRSG